MKCAACGVGDVLPKGDVAKRWAYRTIPDLQLRSDVEIPTCSNCGEQWINSTVRKAIDAALETSFRGAVLEKASSAIGALREHSSQRIIERLLGLSGGYLSKLRGEERDPSPALVAALMLLAKDPARVQELRDSWRTSAVPAHTTTGTETAEAPVTVKFDVPLSYPTVAYEEIATPVTQCATVIEFPGRRAA